jgi:uncharacterized YigZ family protein
MAELLDSDVYYTLTNKPKFELKIKGSRFIGQASYAANKNKATEFIESVRSEFYDATHHCYAYRIGIEGLEFRSSDDGEPSGSAGKPILFTIQKSYLSDIVVVVTRYYGGTKLGVGGLARAYSDATKGVLELCERMPVYRTCPIEIFCTYEDLSNVKRIVDEFTVDYQEEYSDVVRFLTDVPLSKADVFREMIISVSNGRAGSVIKKSGHTK